MECRGGWSVNFLACNSGGREEGGHHSTPKLNFQRAAVGAGHRAERGRVEKKL